jgi:hypothetical protein
MMALWAQRRCGFDGAVGSGHRGLGEDDSAADPGRIPVIGVVGSGMAHGALHHGLGEDDIVADSGTASWA